MSYRLLVCVTASLFAMASAGHAEDCSTAATQADINQCAARNYEAADRILNLVFEQAIAKARQSDSTVAGSNYSYETALRSSQRAWIAYRDADCAPPPRELAGSISPTETADCMTQKTVTRTKELNERIGGE
jgi:uncharacterized protein YecT (DUF1311 family)